MHRDLDIAEVYRELSRRIREYGEPSFEKEYEAIWDEEPSDYLEASEELDEFLSNFVKNKEGAMS